MTEVLRSSWALLLGILFLLIGNGLQATLLGVRGSIEGYDATEMSLVMSAYFAGFLLGSRRAPVLIRNVGHVRVFAALASLISAAFILYPLAPDIWIWIVLRFIVGFSFSGVYVVAESWLNASSSNENRGKALSLYLIVQMLGAVSAQGMINFADPAGYSLFVIMSVLVSLSFLPILLSVSPAPLFSTAKTMSLRELFNVSPLGVVGMFLMGGVFSSFFGMSAVFGTEKGLSVGEISLFVAALYVGGLMLQIPIGILSDRMDRRHLIIGTTAFAAIVVSIGLPFSDDLGVLLGLALVIGGVANPLYSLLIAYTNDYLETDDMAAAAGGLVFLNGLGATLGPLLIGETMSLFGANAFFGFIAILFASIAIYALYRMTRRPSPTVEDASPYAYVTPQASPVAVEVAQEVSISLAEDEANDSNDQID